MREQSGVDRVVLAARPLRLPRRLDAAPRRHAREGARVTDVDGRRFLDFAGGIGCQNTGHRFGPSSRRQGPGRRYLHQCFMVGVYEPYIETCRLLAELSPCTGEQQKSLLVNSGAEANENAVKIARARPAGPR